MLRDPRNVTAFSPGLAERITALTGHVRVDPDQEIDGPVTF